MINTVTHSAVAEVSVGGAPTRVVLGPRSGRLYVTLTKPNALDVIDTTTNAVVTSLPLGSLDPFDVAVHPHESVAYVCSANADSVAVIDLGTNAITGTLSVRDAAGLGVAPDGSRLYVAAMNWIYVIDTETLTATATIPCCDAAWSVALAPDGTTAYVVDIGPITWGDLELPGTVHVLDTSTNTIATRIKVGLSPFFAALTADGVSGYVPARGSNLVYAIDTRTNTVRATIAVEGPSSGTIAGPFAVALTADGEFAYITDVFWDRVLVIDTATHATVATVPVGRFPVDIAMGPGPALTATPTGEPSSTRTATVPARTPTAAPTAQPTPTIPEHTGTPTARPNNPPTSTPTAAVSTPSPRLLGSGNGGCSTSRVPAEAKSVTVWVSLLAIVLRRIRSVGSRGRSQHA